MALYDWSTYNKVLCVRLDNMGDVIMSSPAIRALKQINKKRNITLLTSSAGAGIAKHIPEIDDIIVFDAPWVKNTYSNGTIEQCTNELKQKQFDAAAIFTVNSQNPLPAALLCYQARIPHILCYCRENPYGLINHWIPDKEPIYGIRHQVQRDLDMVRSTGAVLKNDSYELRYNQSKADSILKQLGLSAKEKYILVHPGVSEKKRQFSIRKFVEISARIIRDLKYSVVITGTNEERSMAERLSKTIGNGSYVAAGMTDIEQLIALTSKAACMVSVNTSVIHIASAVQTPVVVLYASTNPQHIPWKIPSRIRYFDVPPSLQSRNTLLQYIRQQYFPAVNPAPTAEEIVNEVRELLM